MVCCKNQIHLIICVSPDRGECYCLYGPKSRSVSDFKDRVKYLPSFKLSLNKDLCTIVIACVSACMCAKSLQSCPTLCYWWTVGHQSPLSVRFSRQEYRSGLPCPPPGDLSDPGFKALALASPLLAGRFFTTNTTWEAPYYCHWGSITELMNCVIDITCCLKLGSSTWWLRW